MLVGKQVGVVAETGLYFLLWYVNTVKAQTAQHPSEEAISLTLCSIKVYKGVVRVQFSGYDCFNVVHHKV